MAHGCRPANRVGKAGCYVTPLRSRFSARFGRFWRGGLVARRGVEIAGDFDGGMGEERRCGLDGVEK